MGRRKRNGKSWTSGLWISCYNCLCSRGEKTFANISKISLEGRKKLLINRGYFIKSNWGNISRSKMIHCICRTEWGSLESGGKAHTFKHISFTRYITNVFGGPLLVFPPLCLGFIRRFMTSPYQMTNCFNLINLLLLAVFETVTNL